MICRTCLRRVATVMPRRPQAASLRTTLRPFATSVARQPEAAAAAATPPAGSEAPASKETTAKPSNIPVSSCPAGTVMQGLNYIKGKGDPVALPDEEYPAWLWTCLKTNRVDAAAVDDTADEYSKSKKQRRAALRKKRQEEKRIIETGDLSALEPKIPLTRQTINLPANEEGTVQGAIAAHEKRTELRSALRRERKAKIKETNYLKSM